jgi:hypothetical protein
MLDSTRNIGSFAVVLMAAYSFVSACEAAPLEDAVGRWKLTCVCPDGKSRDSVINVIREGQALRATYKADGVTRAARRASFDRGILSVEVDGTFAGSGYGLTYKGKPEGDTICGDVHWTYTWTSESFAFKGERVKEKGVAVR